jgi:hypothetical protein
VKDIIPRYIAWLQTFEGGNASLANAREAGAKLKRMDTYGDGTLTQFISRPQISYVFQQMTDKYSHRAGTTHSYLYLKFIRYGNLQNWISIDDRMKVETTAEGMRKSLNKKRQRYRWRMRRISYSVATFW